MPSGMFSWIIHHRDGNIIRLLWYPLLAGWRFAGEFSKALGPAVSAFRAPGIHMRNAYTACRQTWRWGSELGDFGKTNRFKEIGLFFFSPLSNKW